MLVVVSLTAGHLALGHDSAAVALAFALVSIGAIGYAAGHIVKSATFPGYGTRSVSTNLVAVRSGARARPRVWLVAHADSKSQTIPMLARVGSGVAFAIFFAALLGALVAMSVLALGGDATADRISHALGHLTHPLSVLAALSAMPIALCFTGNRSPGAADNASGVAAVLIAAETVAAEHEVGVVITSAEELGLAGARAFAHSEQKGIAINCDTIDDDGRFIFMSKGIKPPRLAAALDRAALRLGIAERGGATQLGMMLPGVLADNIAFTDAGWESVTVCRGNLATLARVHTARDRAEFIEGTGIAQAARLLAATVEELS